LSGVEDDLRLQVGGQELRIGAEVLAQRPALRGYIGRSLAVGIRPEDMEDANLSDAPEGSRFTSKAELVEAMGSDVLVHFTVEAAAVVTGCPGVEGGDDRGRGEVRVRSRRVLRRCCRLLRSRRARR
jgi:ABC-type sugar transport system ATPase subunit